MKLTKKIMYIMLAIPLLGCPDKDGFNPNATILIRNNSTERVVEYREYSSLEDTLLQSSSPFTSIDFVESGTILPNGEKKVLEEKESIARLGSIHLYLINRDTLESVSWERIRQENIVLRRYDLTLDSLEALNWLLEYP